MSAAIRLTLAYKVLTGEQRAELESGTFGGARSIWPMAISTCRPPIR
jgi:hypothetical protein